MRRACGTCRFFQATTPSAKSGWCSHPEKQTTTDVRILVRAGELNCRNDWDSDLWQLREDGDRVLDVTMVRITDHNSPSPRPERPRTLGQDDAPSPVPPRPADDIVIESVGTDAPRLVSEDVNREMLRKARDQFRTRRQSARPDGPLPRQSDEPFATPHRQEPIIISNDVLPFVVGQAQPPDLSRQDRREEPGVEPGPSSAADGSRFSSVPDIEQHVELPRPAPGRPDRVPVVDDFAMDSPRDYDEAVGTRRLDPGPRPRLDRHEAEARRAIEHPREAEPRRETIAPPREERLVDPLPVHQIAPSPPDIASPPVRRVVPEQETQSSRPAYGESERDLESDELRPWDFVEPRRQRVSDVEARDAGRVVAAGTSRLWDDIPRCCRTCRDFRPAETSGRGWCTNRWAFRHRRMVDVDDLPCETTIGAWWLPTDDVWQDDQDLGRHAQATPLMDRWIVRPEEDNDLRYPIVATRTRTRR